MGSNLDKLKNKKTALVHDYLLRMGGAERVLKVLHEMFPQAPIYTVVYDEKFVREFFANCHNGECGNLARGSFLQKLPFFLRKRYKYFSFLIPAAVENLDLSEFNVVISSSSAFCKGVITRSDTVHICYCHTPTRFLWDWTHHYSDGRIFLHFLRFWDKQAAGRVDYFIANSQHIAKRIYKYYGREAAVIYPPVAATEQMRTMGGKGERWGEGKRLQGRNDVFFGDYFLIVSQLRPYKQIDIAVEAFKKLGFNLVIIGEGGDRKRLEKIAGGAHNIEFTGFLSDAEVLEYYRNCKALIFCGEEDFGIVMAEAMLAGKPVLALRAGGALEIVQEGISGEFFDDAHSLVLADGLRRLLANYSKYDPEAIKASAARFSRDRFEKSLLEYIDKCCKIKS